MVHPEEAALPEVAAIVEVLEALRLGQPAGAVDEALVGLVLDGLVPGEDVVGAGDVLGVVVALASAAAGVVDFPRRALVVADVLEHELGAVLSVAVVEVGEVDDVGIREAIRVLGVPAHGEHRHHEGLVGEPVEEHVAVLVVHRGHQELLHLLLREGFCALALVVHPLALLLEPPQNVEDGTVGRAVVPVHRWAAVVGEDVVDVPAPLGHVGLGLRPVLSGVPARDEELFEVVVGDVALGWHEVPGSVLVLFRDPVEVVAFGVLPRVQ